MASNLATVLNFGACAIFNDEIFDGRSFANIPIFTNDFRFNIFELDRSTPYLNILLNNIGLVQCRISSIYWKSYRVLIKWLHRRLAESNAFANIDHGRLEKDRWMQEMRNLRQLQHGTKWYPIGFKLTWCHALVFPLNWLMFW